MEEGKVGIKNRGKNLPFYSLAGEESESQGRFEMARELLPLLPGDFTFDPFTADAYDQMKRRNNSQAPSTWSLNHYPF